jgi:hypothetical protein
MEVIDLVVSKDGNYIAAVNSTGLYYFASNDANPRWWYLSGQTGGDFFLSVAISANGEYVIAGNATIGSIYYFGNSRTRSGLQTSSSYTWISKHFLGAPSDVERGTIDISDDGEYVVVGGTGEDVYYFVDCTSKSGISQMWDWTSGVGGYVHAVDMSADGKYVAVGGPRPSPGSMTGFVAFFGNANVFPYPTTYLWYAYLTGSIEAIKEIAVSDDGYGVAAVSEITPATLYYWADATSLSSDPEPTWTRLLSFSSVDISSDGNRVVAGHGLLVSLHYWDNARTRTGTNEPEKWTELEGLDVWDVAISDDGNTIAATCYNGTSGFYEVYFFTSSDEPLGNYALQSQDIYLSMSGNGGVVAVGGSLVDSLSVFTRLVPVGGEISPVNMLELLAPYLLVFALAIIGAAAVLFRGRIRRSEIPSTCMS